MIGHETKKGKRRPKGKRKDPSAKTMETLRKLAAAEKQ